MWNFTDPKINLFETFINLAVALFQLTLSSQLGEKFSGNPLVIISKAITLFCILSLIILARNEKWEKMVYIAVPILQGISVILFLYVCFSV